MLALAQIPFTGDRIAGLTAWPSGDGGPATDAFLAPDALAFDRDGTLLVADQATHGIRRVPVSGTISTALDYVRYGLQAVVGLGVDSRGDLYLVDDRVPDPSRLLEVTPDGLVTTIATFPVFPPEIAVDASDNLYFSDHDNNLVWKRSPSGFLQVAAKVVSPRSVAFDRQGNLLVADFQRIMRVNPDGSLTILYDGSAVFLDPVIRPARDGSIYIADGSWYLWRWSPAAAVSHRRRPHRSRHPRWSSRVRAAAAHSTASHVDDRKSSFRYSLRRRRRRPRRHYPNQLPHPGCAPVRRRPRPGLHRR